MTHSIVGLEVSHVNDAGSRQWISGQMEDQIDIAIITALKVEREAAVYRLDSFEKLQLEEEPLTFYSGPLTINGGDCYRVVVVQAHDMGNNDAGIAATRTIQRFNPQCVIMVGIAGGVEGKVNLGDIVVAQYVHYYEFAKLKAKRREDRPQQIRCDGLLHARAQHYDESDWRKDIRLEFPDSDGHSRVEPAVRFGPIACGEKVLENKSELEALRDACPKMLAVAMEGWGVGKAIESEGRPVRFLEVRSICDHAVPGKNDDWHEYAANAAAAFSVGLLKTRPMKPLAAAQQSDAGNGTQTLIITAQSLRSVSGKELLPSLASGVQNGSVEFAEFDLTDLVENKQLTRPDLAAERVARPDGKFVQKLAQHADHQFIFHGLCAIPPVILAGHVVSDRQPVELFDFHPEQRNWNWPASDESFPPLELAKGLDRRVLKSGDVVIRVSVSYPISKDDIRKVGIKPIAHLHLTVPSPGRGIVRSEEQTFAYSRVFRALLDSLWTQTPNAERIHLFYAGPMALAFNLGQQISENIHHPVIAWNFSRGYEWGIDIAKAMAGDECIVVPESER